jgi:hypothetical protein
MNEFEAEALRRRFNIGDIVTCEDEGDRLFRVGGYQVTVYFEIDRTDKELMYDLIDAISFDTVMPATDAELTLVVAADKADEFLANRQGQEQPKSNDIHLAIDLSNRADRELIDMVLDKYNDYMAVATDLKSVAPKAALRKWRKDAKECLAELRELMGGEAE